MHLAAQYSAAAGISFLPKKADDSHTNLGFDSKNARLVSRLLDKPGHALALNYESFSLEWLEGARVLEAYPLDGKIHAEVLDWLKDGSKRVTEETPYSYKFHYKLTYPITDSFQFKLKDTAELKHLLDLRILAQQSLRDFLDAQQLESEIRIWPHHFDTGAYTTIDRDPGMAIGLGLAIPDSLSEVHYFYISGYKKHRAISPQALKPLSIGKWVNKDFKGGILPVKGLDATAVLKFLEEAFFALTSR